MDIPRLVLKRLRAVLRQSLLDQEGRRPWPVIRCRTTRRQLVLEAQQGDLALRFDSDSNGLPEALTFPGELLANLEGRSTDPVTLEVVGDGKGKARWQEGAVPRTLDFTTVDPETLPPLPELPRRFTPISATLLAALAEAARISPKSNGKTALTRVLLRGATGQVVSSDGRQLLVENVGALPWPEDLLVPRLSALGHRELNAETELAVGRTKDQVGLRLGPWTFLLAIDASHRFPNVMSVIPHAVPGATRLVFDPADASFLREALPRLPGGDEDHRPITLDLDTAVHLRACGENQQETATEVHLARSHSTGPPVRLRMDRSLLYRALVLGFVEIVVNGADKPLLCEDSKRTYVWVPLESKAALGPRPGHVRVSSTGSLQETVPLPLVRRKPIMAGPPADPSPELPAPGNGNGSARSAGLPDPLEEAEALRGLLQEASNRLNRLLTALKHQRRHSRAVQQAMASLRQLQWDQ